MLPLILLPVWFFAMRFILGGLILWFALVWPLVKVYEFLTIGDIRAKAGEIGGDRGVFSFRRWPLTVRLGIFAATLVAFWGGLAYLFSNDRLFHTSNEMLWPWIGGVIFLALLMFLGVFVFRIWKRDRLKRRSEARAKLLSPLLTSNNAR